MYQANITRDEAKRRSAVLHAQSYEVFVDLSGRYFDGTPLEDPEKNFVSRSVVTFDFEGGEQNINIIADRILEASIDGKPIDPQTYADYKLGFTADKGTHTLSVTGLMVYSHTGEGLHRFIDPADDKTYLYTQFESADARRMYANFEQPDQKATFQFSFLAPEKWLVISNAELAAKTDCGDGFAEFRFEPTKRMSSYITALVAGEYIRKDPQQAFIAGAGEVPMGLICRESNAPFMDVDKIWETTQRGFEVFEEAFGQAYPFGKYDQSFVPEFNAGAMENAGCVTHRDEYLFRSRVTAASYEGRDNTILHELCHMWFGDLVTMTWWDDLWLNESFAEWGAHFAQFKIAQKYNTGVDAWATFCNGRKNWAYLVDQMPTTHPIAADMVDLEAVELNFDGITYAKGASTLKQLVAFVGEEKFLTGIKAYMGKHKFGNTQLSDLLEELTIASGRDLSRFTAEWLGQPGVNILAPKFETAEGAYTKFEVLQSAANPDHPQLRQHRIAIGCYNLVDGKLTRTQRFEVDVDGPITEIAELKGVKVPALLLLNDDDLTYSKIRLDDASLATVVENIDKLDSRLARALCWGAAWDMCRDGEMKPADYIAMVLRGVGVEDDMTAVQNTLTYSQQALWSFVPANQRVALRDEMTKALAALLRDAEPGSDKQLIFARALAAIANSEAAASLFLGWLNGEEVPENLSIDQDLRWTLLMSLARQGKATDAMLDAELAKDTTITGKEAYAAARAARPTAEAKAEAWKIAALDPDTPNETQRKVAFSFGQNEQDEVLAPYTDKYFALVEEISAKQGIWATRSQAIAHAAVTYLFPMSKTQETLDRLDVWMKGKSFSDGVKRQLAERRDILVRALNVQKKS